MADWKTQLAETGDEYLIGLTNKGIVKRAYKDKESACVEFVQVADEAVLKVDGETVTLRLPLGESKCTCPSRSICRHIILGIIVLKEYFQNSVSSVNDKENSIVPADISSKENNIQEADSPLKENNITDTDNASLSTESNKSSLQEQLWNEIRSYPEKILYKAMGARRLTSFQNKVKGNVTPEIEESSVFTIQLPGESTTVKLLSPLEYSSCTCHKKELCPHKAEAVLWCKLKAGVLSLKELEASQKKDAPVDPEQVKNTAVQMKAFLEELMATGLSRISPDVTDSLERFAIISHNAGLADFERSFRSLSSLYQSYLKRQASFQTADLMKKLTKLYRKSCLLLDTEDISALAKEAGEFHAEYLPVGDLELTGITMEHFSDTSGYEGETVYFLETNSNEWYTYTLARPVFYDQRKKWGRPQKAEAPWGLTCSLENLILMQIRLKNAKCDARRRLSSSRETRGEILGTCHPDPEIVPGWYYEDFQKLFSERITEQMLSPAESASQNENDKQPGKNIWGRDLVFVQPAFCEKAVFSDTDQTLLMTLYDGAKREIILELAYSKEEAKNIRYLEKIREDEPPCFIGKVYLKDGRIRLIPVDTWNYNKNQKGS